MNVPTLTITVDGTVLTISEARVVTIGRTASADVRLEGESVSRRHAELRPVDGGWTLADVGSSHGTTVDGTALTGPMALTGESTVHCGPTEGGTTFTIAVAAPPRSASGVAPGQPSREVPQSSPAPPVPPEAPSPSAAPAPPRQSGFADTVVLAGPVSVGPDGRPGAPRTGPDLLVVAEGTEHRFRHPATITMGRQPGSVITLTDPAASRQHARIDAVPGGWSYTNVSEEGSFLDGERLLVHRLEGRTAIRLGHPVAGPAIELVPILSAREEEERLAREKRRRRFGTLGAAVAAAAAVAVVIGLGFVFVGGDDDPAPAAGNGDESPNELTSAELDSAKVATVLILAESVDDAGAPVQYTGSGSIISADGLILTNAHVAEPDAPGLEEIYGENNLQNPEELLIALVREADDSPADPAFRARVVASDGRIDASLIQITATIDGDPVDDLDLPTMPLGDSDDLRTGDDVTVLGFPGIAQSAGVSVTTGVVSSFVDDPNLDTDRDEIDTDARIAPGNSGGAAINNDAEIIGVPSAFFAEAGVPVVSGRIRPINIIVDLFDEVER